MYVILDTKLPKWQTKVQQKMHIRKEIVLKLIIKRKNADEFSKMDRKSVVQKL